jgi:membrane protein required for colicin V production
VNWLDIVLGLILCTTTFAGMRRGFSRAVIGFAATIAGLVLALWFYGTAGSVFVEYTSHRGVANVLGFLVVLSGTLAVGSLAGWLLARTLKKSGLGWMDHLLGAGIGLLRGTIVSIGIVTALSAFARTPPPPSVAQSQIAPYVMGAANVLAQVAPRELREGFDKTYEKVKQIWHGLKASA